MKFIRGIYHYPWRPIYIRVQKSLLHFMSIFIPTENIIFDQIIIVNAHILQIYVSNHGKILSIIDATYAYLNINKQITTDIVCVLTSNKKLVTLFADNLLDMLNVYINLLQYI